MFQSNNSLAHPIFPLDSSAPSYYGQQQQQNPAIHNNISNGTVTHNSVDPLDGGLCPNLGMHLSSLSGFNEAGSQVIIFLLGFNNVNCIVGFSIIVDLNRLIEIIDYVLTFVF